MHDDDGAIDDIAEFHLFAKPKRDSHTELIGVFKGLREKALSQAVTAARSLVLPPYSIPWARITLFEVVHVPVDLTALHTGVQ